MASDRELDAISLRGGGGTNDDGNDDDVNPSAHNPYASSNRWRHQESKSFAKHARPHAAAAGAVAREADAHSRVDDLADFLNSSRITPGEQGAGGGSRPTTPRFKPVIAGAAEARAATQDGEEGAVDIAPTGPPLDGRDIAVGPLLNYRRMDGDRWIGSLLVVTKGGGKTQPIVPKLSLRRADAGGHADDVEGICLYSDPRNTFWRFNLGVPMGQADSRWEYELPGMRFTSKTKPRVNSFWVPAVTESMRIMFHSCNGFSVGTDEAAWSGAALWNDVMRRHAEVPFHIM